MPRLPNVDGPSVTGMLRKQRELQRKQGTASAFAGTGLPATSYVDTGDANTLAAAKAYTDAKPPPPMPGLDVTAAALTIPAQTTTAVPWGTPTENTGGFVVSGNTITVPAGMGGVYVVTVVLNVAAVQQTRAFVNLYMGPSRGLRETFTSESAATISGTARVSDLGIIKAEIFCTTASSITSGWLTAYRLHA